MKKHFYIVFIFIGLLTTACKKESLQSYIIESQEKTEFSHLSIPSSIIKLGANTFSKAEEKTYNSIQKINITGLLAKNAKEGQYETEKDKLKNILKNSDYKSLINFKNNGYNATLYYTGSTEAIDEIIAFGYADGLGVGIARILGNDMNPKAIIKMFHNTDLNTNNIDLTQFKLFFEQAVK